MATLSVSNGTHYARCNNGQIYSSPWIYAELGSCTAVVDGSDWVVTATVWVKTTANSGANITVYAEQILKAWISYGNTNSNVVEMKSARYKDQSSAAFDSISFRIKGSEASTMGFVIHVDTSSIIGSDEYGNAMGHGIYWVSKGINILELYTSTTTSGLPPIYKAPSWRSLSVSSTTTKSITVYAAWNDYQNSGSGYKDADAIVILYNSSGAEVKDGEGVSRRTINGAPGDPSGTITFNNLPHNTNYNVKAYLVDTQDGGKTSALWYGSTLNTKTKKLSAVNTGVVPHQNKIFSTWESHIDDVLNNMGISFLEYKCYLSSDSNKVAVGSNSYDAKPTDNPNRTAITTGLDSYTDYSLYYSITDGFNIVNAVVNTKTIYPYARIFVNGEWEKAMVYVYDGSTWKLTKGNIFDGTSFKEFNGE